MIPTIYKPFKLVFVVGSDTASKALSTGHGSNWKFLRWSSYYPTHFGHFLYSILNKAHEMINKKIREFLHSHSVLDSALWTGDNRVNKRHGLCPSGVYYLMGQAGINKITI